MTDIRESVSISDRAVVCTNSEVLPAVRKRALKRMVCDIAGMLNQLAQDDYHRFGGNELLMVAVELDQEREFLEGLGK
jgi:hypothetical protein